MNQQSRIAYLAQADLSLLISDLLQSPVEADVPEVSMEEISAAVRAAGLKVDGAFHRTTGDAMALRRQSAPDELNDEFNRLFEGAVCCPPNETAYIRRDKGAIIADLCGFYRAFGFSIDGQSGEKPDHLLTELEFVAAALTMAAEAETPTQRATAVEALGQFTSSHVNDWLPAFCHHLSEVSFLPCYQSAGNALSAFWNELSTLNGWPLEAPAVFTAPQRELDTPCECGAVEALGEPTEEGHRRLPLEQLFHRGG